MPGVIRTRAGYAGGKRKNPTYRSIGDHAETCQIDYDPSRITYAQLLDVFWKTHNPCAAAGTRQYMSAIFYQNEEQKKLALQSRDGEATRRKMRVVTEIAPLTEFTVAEDYHQKYYLRQYPVYLRELSTAYPTTKELIASTAAARLNGYAGGHGSYATLEKEISSYGLSPAASQRLLAAMKPRR